MHYAIQFFELITIICLCIISVSGVAGIFYIIRLVLRWEKEENNTCPDKLEPRK
jgi:hypothetical protein